MDFGVFLDFASRKGATPNEIFQESFDLVDLAEQSGLDTVWLGESHFNPNRSVLSAPHGRGQLNRHPHQAVESGQRGPGIAPY